VDGTSPRRTSHEINGEQQERKVITVISLIGWYGISGGFRPAKTKLVG
jgi:hypothetical protein